MQNRNGIMRLVLVALLLYALFGLTAVRQEVIAAEQNQMELSRELLLCRQEHAELESKLAAADSREEMERLARTRLGMVMPGEIVFYFREKAN